MIKKQILLLFIVIILAPGAFPAESDRIQYIKDTYKKISELFANRNADSDPSISKCEIKQTSLPATPPVYSRTTCYWELYGPEFREAFRLRKSAHFFQQGGRLAGATLVVYEEFLFDTDGSVMFYFRKEGQGTIDKPAACKWNREERYYFSGEKLIRIMKGETTGDSPGAGDIRKAKDIINHGKLIRDFAEKMNVRPVDTAS